MNNSLQAMKIIAIYQFSPSEVQTIYNEVNYTSYEYLWLFHSKTQVFINEFSIQVKKYSLT